jgi:hypothetical protein
MEYHELLLQWYNVMEMTSLIPTIGNKHKTTKQESFLSRSSQEKDEQNVYEVSATDYLSSEF